MSINARTVPHSSRGRACPLADAVFSFLAYYNFYEFILRRANKCEVYSVDRGQDF